MAQLAAALSALLVLPTAAAARFPFLPTERSASYPPLAEVAMIIALTGSRAAAESECSGKIFGCEHYYDRINIR